jgi:hypothetical protein
MREDVLNTRQFLVAGGSFDSIESCSRPHSTASICDKICTASEGGCDSENLVLQIVCTEVAQAILDLRRKPIQILVLVHIETWKQIPGIGPIVATAIVAAIGNGAAFRKGREFAAWLGLVPRQYSKGGKARLLGISKRGNSYLRKILVHGARAAVLLIKRDQASARWIEPLCSLVER